MLTVFGSISDPWATISPDSYPSTEGQGLIILANNLLRTIIVFSGIWALFNVITAGYGFLNADGNMDKVVQAWNKIWQSLLGVAVVAGSLALAAILGWLIFNDPTAIINPKIYTPN
ncbi:MAG: hypothetical protein JW991_03625 [Candidatus Pacebacteria bacterium]|nr:hypothetical protein [Candidatus Paceibacterota bacterium]